VLALFVLAIRKPSEVRQLIMFYGFSLLAWPLALQWFFLGHDRMDWVAALSIVRQFVFAGLVFLFMRPGVPLAMLGVFECAAMLAVAAVALFALRSRFGIREPGWRAPIPGLFTSLRQAAPIGLAELTWAFLWYFATVLLGLRTSDQSLGWFGASHRVTMALHTFVWLYLLNLLPSISRSVSRPGEALAPLMTRSLRIAAWSSVFVAFAVTLFSERLLSLAYGPGFAPAARLMSVLVWMIPVAMLSGHYRYTLIGANLQRWLLASTALAATVAVTASFVLIPTAGALGAAIALLAASTVEFAFAYWFVTQRLGGFPFLPALARPVVAVAASVVCYLIVSRWSVLAASFSAAYLYLLFLAAWEWREVRFLYSLVMSRFGLPARQGG
jgi:O-antigen/teichoic acid export membrane protein